MHICHGTSSVHLESILRDGLKPRGLKATNWQAASHADLVYLSQAYALHYAGNAVAEIEFRGWTDDQKLRHASFKGIREPEDNGEVFEIDAVEDPM